MISAVSTDYRRRLTLPGTPYHYWLSGSDRLLVINGKPSFVIETAADCIRGIQVYAEEHSLKDWVLYSDKSADPDIIPMRIVEQSRTESYRGGIPDGWNQIRDSIVC